MKTEKPTKEMESIGDAAARLLRRIEQRKDHRATKPEPIEKGGSAQAAKNALELLPPVALRGGGVSLGYLRRDGKVVRAYAAANLNEDDWW